MPACSAVSTSGECEYQALVKAPMALPEPAAACRLTSAGVPLAIAEQLGRPFFTTKGKGFGLGLFLSQASVTRAGGTVKLYNHEDGGTLTELKLPRAYGVA